MIKSLIAAVCYFAKIFNCPRTSFLGAYFLIRIYNYVFKRLKSRKDVVGKQNEMLEPFRSAQIKIVYVTRFGIMSRKSPKVELRYGPRKSE